MIFQSRIVDGRHLRLAVAASGRSAGRSGSAAPCAGSGSSGCASAASSPAAAGCRRWRSAESRGARRGRRLGDEHAGTEVVVAAEILGRRVYHHVGAEVERALQDRGEKGVVDRKEEVVARQSAARAAMSATPRRGLPGVSMSRALALRGDGGGDGGRHRWCRRSWHVMPSLAKIWSRSR